MADKKEIIKTILKMHANNLFEGKTKSGKNFDIAMHENALPLEIKIFAKYGASETETKEILAEAMLDRVEDALKAEGLADNLLADDFDDLDLYEADSLEVEYD